MDLKTTHCRLNYYKQQTGKWYSEAEYDFPEAQYFYQAIEKIREMLRKGNWPGLVEGMHDFNVHLVIYTEFGPLTCLILRDCL